MIRLGALMLATLAGLFAILSFWGGDDLRAERRPAPVERPAARDAGAMLPDPALSPPQPQAPVVQAATQTPQQVQRFPGPALEPSPEHAGGTPVSVPLSGDGPVLYVTGNSVNMRAGPSTGDRVVAALGRGTAVRPLGPVDAEWVSIRDATGRSGYVAGRFLSDSAP